MYSLGSESAFWCIFTYLLKIVENHARLLGYTLTFITMMPPVNDLCVWAQIGSRPAELTLSYLQKQRPSAETVCGIFPFPWKRLWNRDCVLPSICTIALLVLLELGGTKGRGAVRKDHISPRKLWEENIYGGVSFAAKAEFCLKIEFAHTTDFLWLFSYKNAHPRPIRTSNPNNISLSCQKKLARKIQNKTGNLRHWNGEYWQDFQLVLIKEIKATRNLRCTLI